MARSRLALALSLVVLAACTQSVAPLKPSSIPSLAASPSPSLSPSPPPAAVMAPQPIMVTSPRKSPSSFRAGVSLLMYGNDVSYQKESAILFDQLATDNVNSLSIVFPIYQSSYYATDPHADPVHTPSNAELAWIIQSAKARGFSVMLRPLLDERTLYGAPPGGWRGGIQPSSSIAWFASYDALLVSYARFAQAHGVEAIDIGSELDTMERYTYEWPLLISRLRAVYSGSLTYSSNFEARPIFFGHLLDFISVDAYYRISNLKDPTVAQIVEGWQDGGLPDLLNRSRLAGKPVVVTEVGVWPDNGVFAVTYGGGTHYNPLAQQKFYTATCAALRPSIRGIYWWYVGLTQQPVSVSGHDPLSVPGTDQAISACYAPPFTPPAPLTPFQLHHMTTS